MIAKHTIKNTFIKKNVFLFFDLYIFVVIILKNVFFFTIDGSDHKVQMMFLMKCHSQSSCVVVVKVGYFI